MSKKVWCFTCAKRESDTCACTGKHIARPRQLRRCRFYDDSVTFITSLIERGMAGYKVLKHTEIFKDRAKMVKDKFRERFVTVLPSSIWLSKKERALLEETKNNS